MIMEDAIIRPSFTHFYKSYPWGDSCVFPEDREANICFRVMLDKAVVLLVVREDLKISNSLICINFFY